MILKIFTKRQKGGEHIKTSSEWFDEYYEANRILMSQDETGFRYMIDAEIPSQIKSGHFKDETHGYELYNNSGVLVERFVTAIHQEEL